MPKNYSYSRASRVKEIIQRELASTIQLKMRDPRVSMVTVSSVDLSNNLFDAKVFISVLSSDPTEITQVIEILNRASGFFRSELAKKLTMRGTPKIRFFYDDTIARGERISILLNEQNKKINTTTRY